MAAPSGIDVLTQPKAAAEVAKAAKLEGPAAEMVRPEHAPKQAVAVLAEAGLMMDAVRMVAFALPRREGVWWAAQCLRSVPPLAGGSSAPVLAAAEAWAADPTEANRRAAFAEAEKVEFKPAAASAALAAFWAEGSMGPAENPPVEPPPHVGPGAAATAVVLAAVSVEPEKADERFRAFLALGEQVASGANRWPEEKRPATPPAANLPPTGPRPTSPPPPSPRSYY